MTHFADDRTLARLAALEAVAEAAEAYLDDIECDPYDGTVMVPNETRIRAALAQLRALDAGGEA